MISPRLGNIQEHEILHFCHGDCCCPISLILFLFSCKYFLHDSHVICVIPNIVMQDCIVKHFTMSCPIALMNRVAGGKIFKEPDGDFTIGRTIGPMPPRILVLNTIRFYSVRLPVWAVWEYVGQTSCLIKRSNRFFLLFVSSSCHFLSLFKSITYVVLVPSGGIGQGAGTSKRFSIKSTLTFWVTIYLPSLSFSASSRLPGDVINEIFSVPRSTLTSLVSEKAVA